MSAATAILYKPTTFFPKLKSLKTLFSCPQFRTSNLVSLGESVSKKPLAWNNIRTLCPNTMIKSTEAWVFWGSTGDEGVRALEQEDFIHGFSDCRTTFFPVGLESTLSGLSKWLVAVVFSSVLFWRHDAEALWAAMGSVLNTGLSTILKHTLNQERPVSAMRSDPGMPSSHAQSIFFTVMFAALSIMATGFTKTSYNRPSGCGFYIGIHLLHFVVLVMGCNCAASVYLPFLGSDCNCYGGRHILLGLSLYIIRTLFRLEDQFPGGMIVVALDRCIIC